MVQVHGSWPGLFTLWWWGILDRVLEKATSEDQATLRCNRIIAVGHELEALSVASFETKVQLIHDRFPLADSNPKSIPGSLQEDVPVVEAAVDSLESASRAMTATAIRRRALENAASQASAREHNAQVEADTEGMRRAQERALAALQAELKKIGSRGETCLAKYTRSRYGILGAKRAERAAVMPAYTPSVNIDTGAKNPITWTSAELASKDDDIDQFTEFFLPKNSQ